MPSVCSPGHMVQFWSSASRWRCPAFCFLAVTHSILRRASVSAWRSCIFCAFLFKYLTMTALVPCEPWKLLLIKLFGFQGADPDFIGPDAYIIWGTSLRKRIQNYKYKIECRALEGVPANGDHLAESSWASQSSYLRLRLFHSPSGLGSKHLAKGKPWASGGKGHVFILIQHW